MATFLMYSIKAPATPYKGSTYLSQSLGISTQDYSGPWKLV